MPPLDLQSPDEVCGVFRAAAEANLDASCRRGSCDVIGPPGRLIATGDLHDNPVHFARVVRAAGLDDQSEGVERAHLTLHEVIHSDRLMGGVDLSHRALARVAALKVAHPELVHTLLANHELSQIVGAGIVKNGVRVVEAFNDGLEYVFGEESGRVGEALGAFIRSMALALRCRTPRGDLLCAHSLPGPAMMGRFDPSILDRPLTEEDFAPRQGSAHLMVWGRGYDAEQLEDLVERWGVNAFILGHEHTDAGVMLVEPNAIVVNSDHERGVYLEIDLERPRSVVSMIADAVPLAG